MVKTENTEWQVVKVVKDIEVGSGGRNMVRIQLAKSNGREYVDLRKFYKPRDEEDGTDWLPTAKGVAINAELLPQLIEALTQLRKELNCE